MGKTFKEIVDESVAVIRAFEEVEKKPWGVEGATIELAKQVGELAKHIMMFEGYYLKGRDEVPEYRTSKGHIADELSDIFFMVIRIADHYGISLEEEHLKQLDTAMRHPHMKMKPSRRSTEDPSSC
jgi:NTP pyrophosphatase (non-canonical NTP hydrolase)